MLVEPSQTKVIGFLITRSNEEPIVDFFDAGLNMTVVRKNGFNLYFWGIGEIADYKVDDSYTLSFPATSSLLDRNILIHVEEDEIVIENDWLGSIPVFYNSSETIVSTLPLLCLKDKTLNEAGLSDFFDFGYSVFEHTMFADVRFLRHFSKLVIRDGALSIIYKPDPVQEGSFLDMPAKPETVIDEIGAYINAAASKTHGDIVLPTSSGYDSRSLNVLLKDKSRIRSFTYGISDPQSRSVEVVYAQKISAQLRTCWSQIVLTDYHRYIDKWFDIYGFSTHLHGMYHIDFYTRMLQQHDLRSPTLLSGIVGDAWAGRVPSYEINSPQDLRLLGYTHALSIDQKNIERTAASEARARFFHDNRCALAERRLHPVFIVRLKLMLISYLTQLPEYFGIPTWTPFLNLRIAQKMLCLEEEKRTHRRWQKAFFERVDLNLEAMDLGGDPINQLDYAIGIKARLDPIDVESVKRYINKSRLLEINQRLKKRSSLNDFKNQLLFRRRIGSILRRLGMRNDFLRALQEYYVIETLQKSIEYEC